MTSKFQAMKKVIFLLIPFLWGCAVNQTGYKTLTVQEKEHIVPFDSTVFDKKIDNQHGFSLMEVEAAQLKKFLNKHKYTLLVTFNSLCAGNNHTKLEHVLLLREKYKNEDLKPVVITIGFNFPRIKQAALLSNYDEQIYVISHRYGDCAYRPERLFYKELLGINVGSYCFYKGDKNWFLLKNGKLIEYGFFLPEAILF